MRVRVKYSKQGLMKFIGHLDMMRYFQKACRRAGIDVVYTEGLSPHMSMSFALPLGVGMTSDSEYVDVDLKSVLPGETIVNALNESVPEGIHFTDARQILPGKANRGMTLVSRADYTLRMNKDVMAPQTGDRILNPAEDRRNGSSGEMEGEPYVKAEMEETARDLPEKILDEPWGPSWREDFLRWLDQPEIIVLKKGKKTEKEINIRPLIYEAKFVPAEQSSENRCEAFVRQNPAQPVQIQQDLILGLGAGLDRNIRPELVMQAFAEQTGREYKPFLFMINRDEVYADLGKDGKHMFVSLIDLGERIPG